MVSEKFILQLGWKQTAAPDADRDARAVASIAPPAPAPAAEVDLAAEPPVDPAATGQYDIM